LRDVVRQVWDDETADARHGGFSRVGRWDRTRVHRVLWRKMQVSP
jgi:hypothetical protein